MKNWLLPLLTLLPLSVSAAERIVSVGGDVTEIIYALGAEKIWSPETAPVCILMPPPDFPTWAICAS